MGRDSGEHVARGPSPGGAVTGPLERALRERVRSDEARHGASAPPADTLWEHLERVACVAERLGRAEGVDPAACRLAGLFHDAGKFAGGGYHRDDRPEEEHAVDLLRSLAAEHGLPGPQVEQTAEAILQLYRDDPDPTPLTRVLFDADNLDKLGPLGIGNCFVKAGLRGRGITRSLLHRLTVELTYARHAPDCLLTRTGRRWARPRARQSSDFIRGLIETLREDGLYDFRIEEVEFSGLTLALVVPAACPCGETLVRRLQETQGMKCIQIEVEHACVRCGGREEVRFCRPRLAVRLLGQSPVPGAR